MFLSKLLKLRDLPSPERTLLVISLLALPAISLSLRLWGFRRIQELLVRLVPARPAGPPGEDRHPWEQAQTVARLVRTAVRHSPWPLSCLTQALALWWLLQRQGLNSRVRLGARLRDSRLEAHAWVEFQERVLNDQEDVACLYVPLTAVPQSPLGT